ncbi:MAG: aminotransferase class I/II-fold pyridoxal phosphate-dependent enzyme [Rhodospirillales bacterium]|nr:aminotransferase class I/II-fold pyridoxal phosphate-dependent enzyme [Rhodospirillales bacterium]
MTADHHRGLKLKPETLAAQALGIEDETTGAIVPPIHLSTTYVRNDDYEKTQGRSYIRDQGPTQQHAEQVVAALEGGAQALSFGSGIAACTAAFHALKRGERAAVSRTIYHGVLSWLEIFAGDRGLGVDYFDAGDLAGLQSAVAGGDTRLVWLETPANPTWAITDIKAAAEIAHGAGAMVAVDSTAATPVLTRPLTLGADLVCHSATKFLNGHSDVIGGMLVTGDDQSELWSRIHQHRLYAGPVLGSFEAFLLTRGIRTLYLRVRRQCENAITIARFLETHPKVERVHYPGLQSFPGHEIAMQQMDGGFGGMLSFQVPGGRTEAIETAKRARVFKRATSLGGVESLIEHRKSSESDVTSTPENLIRVSSGIEDVDDLMADLDNMLAIL